MDKALVLGTKDCRFESCQGQDAPPPVPVPGGSIGHEVATGCHINHHSHGPVPEAHVKVTGEQNIMRWARCARGVRGHVLPCRGLRRK